MRIISNYILILIAFISCSLQEMKASQQNPVQENDTLIVSNLDRLIAAMNQRSPDASVYYNRIINFIESNTISDSILLSDCYYYTGTYHYILYDYDKAIELLQKAINYRISADSIDDLYARARTNLGLSYLYSGKPDDARLNLETALATRERIFGADSVILSQTLLNLSATYIDLNMYERALSTSLRAIRLAEDNPDKINKGNLVKLYYNSGASYINILDYSRAERNFNLAYGIMQEAAHLDTQNLLLLYNSLAVCNYELGNSETSNEYFLKALNLIDSTGLSGRWVSAVNKNYAFYLADDGKYDRAEEYLLLAVDEAAKEYGYESRDHIIELTDYAYYLINYSANYEEAERILNKALLYIKENEHDNLIRIETYLSLARLMYNTDRYLEALKYIKNVINDSSIVPSYIMIASFIQKSKISYELYIISYDSQFLADALSAAEDAIGLIEETRLKINADESRSRLAGRFYDAYDIAVALYNQLYDLTGDTRYSKGAFTVSEKSKAAGLLAATRNNWAMNFHLPDNLASLERALLADIRDYNEVIYKESEKQRPDNKLIDNYRLQLVRAGTRYDSLVNVFEKDYPRYYNLKYNTGVSSIADIRKALGKKADFVEYYLTDSLLYIFLINNNGFELESIPTGDDLTEMIIDFRNIITNPLIADGSRSQYDEYIKLASGLYNRLILPVKEYLSSDRLVISADNILAYIPFETLISEAPESSDINYRDLDYLLKEYEIIYEYSGTLFSETVSSRRSVRNTVLSFAPEYRGSHNIEELMMSRQLYRDTLTNIPGAREEAIYINKLLGGKLFIDERATESTFKANVIEGDIIHLAMHTLLNDNEPMYSKMIFNLETDTIEDGMLNTYEVYNIPVEAKMMFLSSCNTGTGYLQSGEGVMSLARGFFYSGSPCVIMSLWEVDDLSGSEIVKDFYLNLKRGLSKSRSLRDARIDYLKNANQMRSHPYFWSTLVIMGNDDSVYFPVKRYILIALLIIVLYFVSRYYYGRKSA